jgi:hypothetical protein
MDVFYIIVLTVAVCLLIAILAYIGVKMSNKSSNVSVYPPTALPCPDYWSQTTDTSGNTICVIPPYVAAGSAGPIPSNTGKIYNDSGSNTLNSAKPAVPGYTTKNGNVINFSDPAWAASGKNSICSQKQWANTNLVQWDGISNYGNC